MRLPLLAAGLLLLSSQVARADKITIRLKLDGREIEGAPLSWSEQNFRLLARDGQLWDFAPSKAKEYSITERGFRSYSQAEVQGLLRLEFGRLYEITGTSHYLVVHPKGQKDRWPKRFEQLYRSFIQYFAVRGLQPTEPKFPLTAIVFPRKSDFQHYAASQGVNLKRGVLGYYSPKSNRILMYDTAAGRNNEELWHLNAETIIHEATHQMAFNTSIHSRFAKTPLWTVEGLGLMFEARGVWNNRLYRNPSDRVHRYSLAVFKKQRAKKIPGSLKKGAWIADLAASDQLFRSDPKTAYARAWAMTFYFMEREPQKYTRFLSLAAAKPSFKPYRSEQRLRDFVLVFGEDFAMLEGRIQRFIDDLR